MISKETGYGYADLCIKPAEISEITSRSQCMPFDDDGFLPIFTAPMPCVINSENASIFESNLIHVVMPRTCSIEDRINNLHRGRFVALSLEDFKEMFVDKPIEDGLMGTDKTYKVCIDMANGHMHKLYDTINEAKEIASTKGYKLIIMTGNIASPDTYKWICENANVDYIRLNIGGGSGCLTSTNTGIHYPIATLIDKCNNIRTLYDGNCMSRPRIIADGGIRTYADITKALALGADYVMIGGMLAALLDSAAKIQSDGTMIINDDNIIFADRLNDSQHSVSLYGDDEEEKLHLLHCCSGIYKEFYGMSTKYAQKLINPEGKLKTSEGCMKILPCTHTIKQWAENCKDYMRSAMSYCNAKNLYDFIGKQTLVPMTSGEVERINK